MVDMARIRNEETFNSTRSKLLTVGMDLIRASNFESVGINDVLRVSSTPKGSFYHYFKSKEMFGLEVAKHYNELQLESARAVLHNAQLPALECLKRFFKTAHDDFKAKGFSDGCLMCNLSTELAHREPAFQKLLKTHWRALSSEISDCISRLDKSDIGLDHLTDNEAADWLLNSWSGALTRMKAAGDGSPLKLFLKTTFKR